jgi:hypothetical protein
MFDPFRGPIGRITGNLGRRDRPLIYNIFSQVSNEERLSGESWLSNPRWILTLSTDVRAIAYDQIRRHLYVQFNSGSIYRYYGVPVEIARDMRSCSSMGKFVWGRLRNKYPFSKLRD